MLFEFEFQGRKPSNAQVLKQINEAIRQNCRVIYISWGENRIELQRMPQGIWLGSGWIKNISGYDLASKINSTNKFIKNHFQFVHIGA
jgi:hypothetical protein